MFGLKKKVYKDNESPDQKKNEAYRVYNKGTRCVIYKDAKVFEMASAGGPGGWGNHIAWSTPPGNGERLGSVVGFCRRFPKVGELIVSRFDSGAYYYFAVLKVRPCKDPPDMFFADVSLIMKFKTKLTHVKVMN